MTRSGWKAALLTPLQVLLTLLLFAEVALALGLAAWPGAALWLAVAARVPADAAWRLPALCVAGAAAYFVAGLALLVVVPTLRWLTLATGTPVGRFPFLSLGAWRWASFNALTLLVRFSFINWIRLTPFVVLYHRLMGARIGARVQINTAVIADQNLLTIGDDTVIGGDVTLVAHVAERGRIVTAPITIGRDVTVGLMAVIFPGCTIGDGAVISAGSVLSKHAKVGPGEVWAGVPARRVGRLRRPAPAPAGRA
jgi:non-ribosomal peptide synthetase-like protein